MYIFYVHLFYSSLKFPHCTILSDLLALESRESEHYATVAAEVEAQRLMRREVIHTRQCLTYDPLFRLSVFENLDKK